MRPGVVRVQLDGLLEGFPCLLVRLIGHLVEQGIASNGVFPCVQAAGWLRADTLTFVAFYRRIDDRDNLLGDFVLNREDVFEVAVVLFRPDMMAGFRIDQLSGHANPAACLANTAFDDISRAEYFADLPYVGRAAFEGEGRISRDHRERPPTREGGNDVLRQTVGEIFLLGIVGHILERQHGDRGAAKHRIRGLRVQGRVIRLLDNHLIDIDGLGNVLQ